MFGRQYDRIPTNFLQALTFSFPHFLLIFASQRKGTASLYPKEFLLPSACGNSWFPADLPRILRYRINPQAMPVVFQIDPTYSGLHEARMETTDPPAYSLLPVNGSFGSNFLPCLACLVLWIPSLLLCLDPMFLHTPPRHNSSFRYSIFKSPYF